MNRREMCWSIVVSPFSLLLGTGWHNDIPVEWQEMFNIITSVRFALPGELPDGAFAGLLVRPDGYHILLTSTEDREYTVSVLIHEAWHAHQHKQGRQYYGHHAEREAWSIQALCLSSINPKSSRVPWLWEQSTKQLDSLPLSGNPEQSG